MTILWLNDAKVLKHFGPRPWLGKRMRLKTINTTAGIVWRQFGKKYVPNPITVEATLVLKKTTKPGFWEVIVADQWREDAEWWLVENCR
jgi:hypothetical protein